MTGPVERGNGPSMDAERTEQLLRAALAARAEQVTERELRPGQAPVPQQRQPAWRSRPLVAMAAAAAVMVVFAVGVDLAGRQTGEGPSTVTPAEPLTVGFTSQEEILPGGATVAYPQPQVTGGAPGIAARARTLLSERVEALVARFRSQVGDQGQSGAPEAEVPMSLTIEPAPVLSWRQYVSVRLDVITNLGGARPSNSSSAVVLGVTSGAQVQADEIFTDVDAVDRLMRERIAESAGPLRYADEVARLSMRPGTDGSTEPLAWYVGPEGLHWVVDRDAIAAGAVGQPEALLPWSALAGLMARPASG
jgi:hypothetical protein